MKQIVKEKFVLRGSLSQILKQLKAFKTVI